MGKVIAGIGMTAVAAFFAAVYLCMTGWLFPAVMFCSGVEVLPDGERVATLYDYQKEYRHTLRANEILDETSVTGVLVWSWGTPDDFTDDDIIMLVHAPFTLDPDAPDFPAVGGFRRNVILIPERTEGN